jgi:two-component system invasion response regulator UvrY
LNSEPIAQPIRVLLVDDHPVVRSGCRYLLENTSDIRVVAEGEDGEQGCALAAEHAPDVTVLDLSMPGIGGLETIRRVRAYNPTARILVFTTYANEVMLEQALAAGAAGYLTKRSSAAQLVAAIREVTRGNLFIDPGFSPRAVHAHFRSANPLALLSKREFQVFQWLAEGKSVQEIALALSLSAKTVGVHQTNIMRKLKIRSAAQLVRLAIRSGAVQV